VDVFSDGSIFKKIQTIGGHFVADDDDGFAVFADNIDSEFLPKGENSI